MLLPVPLQGTTPFFFVTQGGASLCPGLVYCALSGRVVAANCPLTHCRCVGKYYTEAGSSAGAGASWWIATWVDRCERKNE